MKQITYAGTTFVTGTAIADSLLRLVAALGHSNETSAIRVPALDADDNVTTIDLVIGPSSEIVATTIASTAAELIDEVAVIDLEFRSESLAHPRAASATADSLPDGWDEPDLDAFDGRV